MDFAAWLGFSAVWIALSVYPGPNVFNVIAVSGRLGFRRGGLWAVAGVTAASALYIAATAFGIGALILASAELFAVLKWVGALYLLYLAYRFWTAPPVLPEAPPSRRKGIGIALRSAGICLTNPKSAVSYIVVFAPFVDPQAGISGQLVLMTATMLTITTATYTAYGLLGGGVRRWLSFGGRLRVFNRIFAVLFALTGCALAASPRPGG